MWEGGAFFKLYRFFFRMYCSIDILSEVLIQKRFESHLDNTWCFLSLDGIVFPSEHPELQCLTDAFSNSLFRTHLLQDISKMVWLPLRLGDLMPQ